MLNRTKFLSDTETEKLLNYCKNHRKDRNALAFELLLRTGARACELLEIKVQDLCQETLSVLIRGAKGSNDREIPLSKDFFDALQTYAREVNATTLFPIKWITLHHHWQNYRPVKKSLHSLRHTYAIRLFRKTKDIKLVQTALGHRDISNTTIYADYVYSTQELKKAMPFR